MLTTDLTLPCMGLGSAAGAAQRTACARCHLQHLFRC